MFLKSKFTHSVLTAKDSCKCIDNNAEDRLGHLFPLFKKSSLICRFTKNMNSKRQCAKSLSKNNLQKAVFIRIPVNCP